MSSSTKVNIFFARVKHLGCAFFGGFKIKYLVLYFWIGYEKYQKTRLILSCDTNTGANRREANGLHTNLQGAFFPDLYPKKRTNLTNTIGADSLDSKSS